MAHLTSSSIVLTWGANSGCKILQAVQHKRGDQAALLLGAHIQTSQTEVRKITLHQVHLARQAVC